LYTLRENSLDRKMPAPAPGNSNGQSRSTGAPQKLHSNIAALREDREAAERARTVGERIADAVTAFAGSMYSVGFHLLLYGGWLTYNSGFLPVEPFDPFPFVMLAMMASVEAIFLTTFVLISQNRNAAIEERREDLGLQVSLLTEHEITRLAQLVDLMASRLGVDEKEKPELADIKQEVAPVSVLRSLDEADGSDCELDQTGEPRVNNAHPEQEQPDGMPVRASPRDAEVS
jgi:uncharacterized membrane protein